MSFPWADYYTIATAVFRWPDERFWKSTPNILHTLWDSYLRLNGMAGEEEKTGHPGDTVYRNGKPYHHTTAGKATWADKIF